MFRIFQKYKPFEYNIWRISHNIFEIIFFQIIGKYHRRRYFKNTAKTFTGSTCTHLKYFQNNNIVFENLEILPKWFRIDTVGINKSELPVSLLHSLIGEPTADDSPDDVINSSAEITSSSSFSLSRGSFSNSSSTSNFT